MPCFPGGPSFCDSSDHNRFRFAFKFIDELFTCNFVDVYSLYVVYEVGVTADLILFVPVLVTVPVLEKHARSVFCFVKVHFLFYLTREFALLELDTKTPLFG